MSDVRLRADFTDHQLWWLYYDGALDADTLLRVVDFSYGIPSFARARAAFAELANAPADDQNEAPAAGAAAADNDAGWVPDEDLFGRRPSGQRGRWSPLQHYEAEVRQTMPGARTMPGASFRAFAYAAWARMSSAQKAEYRAKTFALRGEYMRRARRDRESSL